MVQINFAQKQINAKVVYYGPGMSGKTTNLEVVHQRAPDNNRGELTSISTDGDRTLFFDYMPLDLGTIAGMKTCFQMYTVPGQVYYNSTRKLVLQGVDGVIFVADSGPDAMEANLESLRNLEENLNEYGKSLATMPHVIQFNKRDLPGALSVEEMDAAMNAHGAPTFEGVAATGQGVFPTLKGMAALVLKHIQSECSGGSAAPGGMSRTAFNRAPQAPAGASGAVPAGPAAPGALSSPAPGAVAPGAVAPGAVAPTSSPGPSPSPAPAAPAAPAASAPSGGGLDLEPTTSAPAPPVAPRPATPVAPAPSAAPQRSAVATAPTPAPAATSPSQLMQPSGSPAPAPVQSTRPAQRTRTTAPAPQIRRQQSSGGAKTAAFVVVAALIGAVVAHFVLGAL